MGSAVAGRINSGRLGALIGLRGAEASPAVTVDGPESSLMVGNDMGGSVDSGLGAMAFALPLPLAAAASLFRAAMASFKDGRVEEAVGLLVNGSAVVPLSVSWDNAFSDEFPARGFVGSFSSNLLELASKEAIILMSSQPKLYIRMSKSRHLPFGPLCEEDREYPERPSHIPSYPRVRIC